MSTHRLITTREAAELLRVTPRTIARQVAGGKLVPLEKLPGRNGAYLFDGEKIDALAAATGSKAK